MTDFQVVAFRYHSGIIQISFGITRYHSMSFGIRFFQIFSPFLL